MYRSFLSVTLLVLFAATAHGQWGTVKGKIVFDGKVPTAAKLNVNKDLTVCGKNELFSEDLVVNADNNGVKNVVVSLYLRRGKKTKIHPDYAATENDSITLDNTGCRFEPHIALLRTSQTLLVKNSDPVGHNTKIDFIKNSPINPIIPGNQNIEEKVSKAEPLPIPVSCSIHPWMTAKLVVNDHPYMALTDADGNFEIKNLPTGKLTLRFWHESGGYITAAKQGGKTQKWKSGRMSLTVKKGLNDLGEISVKAAEFK